jgi:hypothetical protein
MFGEIKWGNEFVIFQGLVQSEMINIEGAKLRCQWERRKRDHKADPQGCYLDFSIIDDTSEPHTFESRFDATHKQARTRFVVVIISFVHSNYWIINFGHQSNKCCIKSLYPNYLRNSLPRVIRLHVSFKPASTICDSNIHTSLLYLPCLVEVTSKKQGPTGTQTFIPQYHH